MADSIRYAAETNPGGGGSKVPQQDVVQAGPVTTAGGLHLGLALVVDGDGDGAGPVAQEALQKFVAAVTDSRQPGVLRVLEQGLKAAAAVATQATTIGEPIRLQLAAAAIHSGRLFWLSQGQTRVYVVRNSQMADLLPGISEPLGSTEYRGPVEGQGRALRRGESVVLCSDGLTQPRGPDKPAFVTDEEIAHWVKGQPALKAARYLLSEALGRNAPDNLSAVVMEVPPSPFAAFASLPVLGALALVVIGLLGSGGALFALTGHGTPTPTVAPTPVDDPGQVSLTDGQVSFDAGGTKNLPRRNFDLIGRGGLVSTSSGSASLALHSPSAPLPDPAAIYLGSSSAILLDQLWPAGGVSKDVTRFVLQQGSILVDGQGSPRTFVISTTVGVAKQPGSSTQRRMAVEIASAAEADVYCLQGQCSVQWAGELTSTLELRPGKMLRLTTSGADTPQPIAQADIDRWLELCAAACGGASPAAPTSTPGPTPSPMSTAGPTASPTLPADVVGLAEIRSKTGQEVSVLDNPNGTAINSLANGDKVYVLNFQAKLANNASWLNIRMMNGLNGWVLSSLLNILQRKS